MPSFASAGPRPRLLIRDAVLVAGSAGLYAWSLPPHDWSLAAWVALVPLLAVVERRDGRGAWLAGFAYGTVFFAVIVAWVVSAVRAYFETGLGPALVFSAAICLLYVAVWVGAFAVAARALLARGRWWALLGIPALWVAVELVRTHLPPGLPWGFLGHSQWQRLPVVQIADLGGVYAVSFVVALANVAVYLTLRDFLLRELRGATAWRDRGAALAPMAVAVALVAVSVGYGLRRLADETPEPTASTQTFTLVQGNAPVVGAWQAVASARALVLYGNLTRRALVERPALVIWPEYAVPLYPENDSQVLTAVRDLATASAGGLVFGAPRTLAGGGGYRNAAYYVAPDGRLDAYEKRHLVPFAEYRPLGLGPAVADAEDRAFGAGARATPFATGYGRLGMLICWEVTYPALVRDLVRDGAELLVNIANDGWLDVAGLGAAEQHLASAVFRAVETRRYLARAASTGISGFVDPTGRPFGLLEARTRGTTSGELAPRRALTVYVRVGDLFAFVCVGLGLALWVGAHRGRGPA